MKKPRVLLSYPIHEKVIREVLAPNARISIPRNKREFLAHLQEAEGLITRFMDPVTERLLDHAPRLKVVGNFAVGIDNIDLKACAKRGIRVVNTPDVLTRATAELTIALLFAAARRIPEGEMLCRAGRFKGWEPSMLLGLELKGRRAVLVGKGRIGSETGRLMRGLGLRVSWITREDSENQIQQKLAQAEILSLHVSLNPETRHWLNRTRLAALPRDCIVINTTRGPVVDEMALIEALEKRRIFAAGLDVYEHEPRIPSRMRKLPNTVLLPHLGSSTLPAREQMARLVITGVLGILGGKAPRNEVRFRI